jgi:hypothetical protein
VDTTHADDAAAESAAQARREARRLRLRRERARARVQRIAMAAVFLVALLAVGAWAYANRDMTPHPPAEQGALHVLALSESVVPTAGIDAVTAYATEFARSLEPTIPPLVPAPGGRTIVLDKSDQLVTLYEADGSAVDRFQCASGHTYPRVGTYTVTSRKPQSMYLGDRTIFFHFVIFTKADNGENIGFHSIPIDGAGNPVGGLGKPESHGCVRLANEKAAFVYDWARNGTQVVVVK